MDAARLLESTTLNPQQFAAASFGNDPLLIVAGAGTGKTNTLAHRVAYLIATGVNPSRILLLTFTRRAAKEMARRVENILASVDRKGASAGAVSGKIWHGTFHAIANRLLRLHAQPMGLSETFSVLDRSDAEDLLNDVRSEMSLDKSDVR